jgi:hypothetical protein
MSQMSDYAGEISVLDRGDNSLQSSNNISISPLSPTDVAWHRISYVYNLEHLVSVSHHYKLAAFHSIFKC